MMHGSMNVKIKALNVKSVPKIQNALALKWEKGGLVSLRN